MDALGVKKGSSIPNKDKIGKKLEEAGKVYKYTNPIYLIFFKSYKQEMYLINAQNKGDVSGMEQNKNALMQDAKEGKKKLKQIGRVEVPQEAFLAALKI